MTRRPAAAVILLAALGLLLVGCAPATSGVAGSATVPAAKLSITPANGSHSVAPDKPITVTAAQGHIRRVTVRTAGDQVTGTLNAAGTTWTSTGDLNVSQSYTVTAVGVNAVGKTVTTTSTFGTLTPSSTFATQIFEALNGTYGVGMPIELTFSHSVTDKSAVERALHVTTSQPVIGAWTWLDDTHVDFRPRDYWPAHTTVNFSGMLDGVQIAPGVYGHHDLTQTFQIGDSLIVTASTSTHHMQVYLNGALQYDWPISTGKPGDDTPNGTYLTIEKANPQEMKPAHIAPGAPGYYDLKVPWSVRFTWSGDFLHDAYWSVGQQGNSDVSHGCVNMPPAAAQTYYQEEVPGDPVTITGSPLAGQSGDGWTDWFHSWPQVLAGSALGQAVEAGPNGSTFVPPSTLPADPATAPLGTSAANNSAAG